jgi:hypothetical protein
VKQTTALNNGRRWAQARHRAMAIAAPTGECDDRPVTEEAIDWLRQCLDRDRTRLLNTARDAAGTPGGSVVTRLAMDQVSGIASALKVIDIAEKALADGDDARFSQIIAWLAYARSTAPGYLDTWAPEEVDLVAELKAYDDLKDLDDDEPDR